MASTHNPNFRSKHTAGLTEIMTAFLNNSNWVDQDWAEWLQLEAAEDLALLLPDFKETHFSLLQELFPDQVPILFLNFQVRKRWASLSKANFDRLGEPYKMTLGDDDWTETITLDDAWIQQHCARPARPITNLT